MAPWVLAAIAASAAAFLGMSSYFFFYGDSYLLRYAGMAAAAFALAATADALFSRIVLADDTMHVNSLMKRRSFARADFLYAKVERGVVALRRRDGGWLLLPGTGHDPLLIRNRIDAWIKRA